MIYTYTYIYIHILILYITIYCIYTEYTANIRWAMILQQQA